MNHGCSARPAVRLDMLPYARGGPKWRDVGGHRPCARHVGSHMQRAALEPIETEERTGSDINHPETASWVAIEPVLSTWIGHEIGHPDTALGPGLHLSIL